MQTRSCRLPLLLGALATLAVLTGFGTNAAAATTTNFAAIFNSDCALADSSDASFLDADSSDLSFMEAEPTTPAPNTPNDKNPKSCRINGNCWKPAYCAKEVGTCKGKGVCKPKPESCPQEVVEKVCGCNHKTYNSECQAAQAGQNVIHKGECEEKGRKIRKSRKSTGR